MTIRDEVLDRYAAAPDRAVVAVDDVHADAASIGEVIGLGKRLAVVKKVTWEAHARSWLYDCFLIVDKGRQIGQPTYTTAPPHQALASVGRWTGLIQIGARGSIVPSDASDTNPDHNPAATAARTGGSSMPTVTRKSPKAVSATAKARAAAKGAANKPAPTESTTPRKPKFSLTKAEATAIAKRLRDGSAKMNDIKAEHGLSNGQPIRNALLEHGFDSKGRPNSEGLTARQIQERDREANAAALAAKAKTTGKKVATKKATPAAKDPS